MENKSSSKNKKKKTLVGGEHSLIKRSNNSIVWPCLKAR